MTLDELDQHAPEFNRAVAATTDIDHFCSSTDWILPADRTLMPRRAPWIFAGQHGYAALMRGRHPDGWRYLEPLEAMWGLACPLVGENPGHLALEFAGLCRQRAAEWEVILLSGLPVGSQLLAEVIQRLLPHFELLQGRITTRHVASLQGGIDGFLSRRSRNFRKALRQALRNAERDGISFEACYPGSPEETAEPLAPDAAERLYDRIMGIERRSWKGQSGVGIDGGGMHGFYDDMVRRLVGRSGLRLLVARHQDQDIAYVLGGVFGTSYRGLQFSFDDDYAAYSLGNLCQYHQIALLCQEGLLEYDLGTGMDYKRRWAELTRDSLTLIVAKH